MPGRESAGEHLEGRRWQGKEVCPDCGCFGKITAKGGKRKGFYPCRGCGVEFAVWTKSIFERSHVPFYKWVYAMYLVVTARKGISSLQLSKQIGVTQKTVWFNLGRLREACGNYTERLRGTIEVDEVHIGGRERNRYESMKPNTGRGAVGEQAVLGIRERGKNLIAMPVENTSKERLHGKISEHVDTGFTDEHKSYGELGSKGYAHASVKYSASEQVGGKVMHVKSPELSWTVFKQSLYETWHHCSRRHLARYLNAATFWLSGGNLKAHTLEWLAITYKAFRHGIA